MRRFIRSSDLVAFPVSCVGLVMAAILALPLFNSAPIRAQQAAVKSPTIAALESGKAVKASTARKRATRSSSKVKKGLARAETNVLGTWGARRIEDTLYGVGEQIDGVRIGWYINDTITGFKEAVDKNVPLVLIFFDPSCSYCWDTVDAMTCPMVNRFAGAAVFAIANPEADKAAKAIEGSLEIKKKPTISVILPESRMLLEIGRINGYFPGNKLSEHLTTIAAEKGRQEDLGGGEKIFVANNWVLKKPPAGVGTVRLSKSAGRYVQKCT